MMIRTFQRSWRAYVKLGALIFFWALNWPLVKIGLAYISPVTFAAARLCGGALVMVALAIPLKVPLLPVKSERKRLFFVGLCQISAMVTLSTIGMVYVGAGRTAVLVYTMQLWALPLGRFLSRERITGATVVGGLIGFAGMMVFLNPMLVNWKDSRALLGNGLVLASAMCWAFGACLYRRYTWQTPYWTQTLWQILWAGVATGIAAALVEAHHPIRWSMTLAAVIAYTSIVATAVCWLWWSEVLSAMPVARAGQLLQLIPITALLMSAAALGERITPGVGVSIALITIGISVTLRGKAATASRQANESCAVNEERASS